MKTFFERKLSIILSLFAFLLVVACSSDPYESDEPADNIFTQTQSASAASLKISEINPTSVKTILTLSDESTIEVPNERTLDITDKSNPEVKKGSKTWLVNGVDTKVNVISKNALPKFVELVCAAYDDQRMLFYFSNETILTLYRIAKRTLSIPSVYISIENGQTVQQKDVYLNMSVRIEDPDKLYSEQTLTEAVGRIKGRGNSTWNEAKKPYRLKLDSKTKIFGLSTDKDWALLANFYDKTLLRNITAFKAAKIAGMDWTPGSLSVELYVNNVYQGVYSFTEHVKVSNERLNINLVDADKTVGDYFLELDFHYDEPYKFKTQKEQLPIMFKDPEEPNQQQFDYVKDFFNTAESALYGQNFTNPESGYRKYIDVESFIKYYIVQELAKNVDGNMRGSCYLALSGGKIKQPLVWDFDIAFGSAQHITWEQGASSTGPEGWYIKTCSPWFDQFFKDPEFVKELKKKWNELKPELDKLPQFVKDHAMQIDDAQRRNFSPRTQQGAGWDIHRNNWPDYVDRGSYDAEVAYLISFIEKRLKWLDTNINAL